MNAIQKACEALGSQRAMSDSLTVTPATVNQWVSGIRPVPEDRCPAIERATSGAVTCEELLPAVAWVRIPDPDWPHPNGRPLVDHTQQKKAA